MTRFPGVRRVALLTAAALALGVLTAGPSHAIAPPPAGHRSVGGTGSGTGTALPQLPAPPAPPTRPKQPKDYVAPHKAAPGAVTPKLTSMPASAKTWGPQGSATTLVLYDSTGEYGWLGELYATGSGNLATHFGRVTAEPVVDYRSGQLAGYSATVYLGSTYDEPLPQAFLTDALNDTAPLVWAGANIWQLSGTGSAETTFAATYGWDPSTSYYDSVDSFASVGYNARTLTRNTASGPLLVPHVTGTVSVLGSSPCTDSTGSGQACDEIAQVAPGATSVPWAVKSQQLTYVSEIPLSYMTEQDRYLALADLLYATLAPNAPVVHQALVRLEDVSPGIDTPAELEADADYLSSQGVPFSVGVIPDYLDPNGFYTKGVPQSYSIADTANPTVAAFDAALRYMQAKGGTIIEHGYTHQFQAVDNPYDGVTGDDFEFYAAHCSTTQGGPPDPTGTCPITDWVVQDGPVPGDSRSWAAARVKAGRGLFASAGFATPAIWETPHYSASAPDYAAIAATYSIRYERDQFFSGVLSPGGATGSAHVFGQFFPYVVTDPYGDTVIPEDAANYEPDWSNNNPPKPASLIIANAQADLAVRQGVASFFFHPYYDLSQLQAIVTGIKNLGYTFVTPGALLGGSAPVVTAGALPNAQVGHAYSARVRAAGGTGGLTYSVSAGSLPAGLSLNSRTGAVSGTPSIAGDDSFGVQAADGTGLLGSATVTVHVAPPPGRG